ncbi:hypothetical protein FO519_008689 [Halicephalobus sp. NKZ332]|nr:hypothetical protein FO519_008689 [Halicephalobus sp. NKZ332]
MRTLCILGLVLLAFLVINDASPLNKKKPIINKRHMIRGRLSHGLVPKGTVDPTKQRRSSESYITQKIDNFDSSNTATYQQRYWSSDEWYKPGGPQFLMIGGESGEDPYWVDDGTLEWTKLAAETGAMVFLLEHRFYGSSQPTSDLTFASLKYLTSEQALADVNSFITAMNSQFNFTNPRWITFGGSYSGALSAWARQVYPNNVYAAVGSSGPVQAVVDMTGYLETVYSALNNYNPACATSLYNGMLQINKLMKTDSGRTQVSSTFQVCDTLPADADNIAYFYEAILGNYMGIVQYSEDNVGIYANELTIPELCKRQMDSSIGDDMARVANVNSWLMQMEGEWCLGIDYNGYIDYLKNAQAGGSDGDYRSWIWQTCNEYGFYQSTDSSLVINNMTGEIVIPVDWYVKQCAQIYDSSYDNSTVYSKVDATNVQYKGQNGFTGTRVTLPNGTNDPWHVLGVLKATNNKVYPLLIDGTSHCADMYAAGSNDKPGLTAARASLRTHVISWVNE